MSPRDPPDTARPEPDTSRDESLSNVLEENDTPDEHEDAAIFEHERAPVASDIVGARGDPDEETEDVAELIDKLDPRLNREKPPI